MSNIKILLIAAGASKRMGTPKQLLPWQGKTLIEHQLENLLKTKKDVAVVLGAYSDEIIKVIHKFPISIHINKDWKKGMGNSIAFGVGQLLKKDTNIAGILIALVDQPLLTATHFNTILNSYKSGNRQIIASKSVDNWFGAPVLFGRFYFDELSKLTSDNGAKVIIKKHKDVVQFITANKILVDVDTPESYRNLIDKF